MKTTQETCFNCTRGFE